MFKLIEQPCWPIEAITALSRRENDDYDVIMSHPEKFGKNATTMKEMFLPYLKYKEAVLVELNQIFSKYQEVQHFLVDDSKLRYELLMAITWALVDRTTFAKLDESILSDDNALRKALARFVHSIIADEYEEDDKYELAELEEPSKVVKYLGNVNLESDMKFKLMELYLNAKEVLPAFGDMMKLMIACLKKHYHLIEKEYTRRKKEVLKPEFAQWLVSGNSGLVIELNKEENYRIVSSIFQYNGFAFRDLSGESKGIELIEAGMYYYELVSEKKNKNFIADSEMALICKALGDPNRYRMLQLFLKNEKMYLQELAKAIGVTPATASHHLALLIEAEVITILVNEKEKKVVYYQANRDRLNQIAQTFQNMAQITND